MTDSVARDVVSLAAIKEASPGSVTTTDVIRVVLIEDDDNYRQALAEDLSDRGFSVQCFADGASFLQSPDAARDADVVLLDWGLPQTSGIDLLPQLRRLGIRLPVVFLTGCSAAQNESLAFEKGASDFVDKARGVDILARRLRRARSGFARSPAGEFHVRSASGQFLPGLLCSIESSASWLQCNSNRRRLSSYLLDTTLASCHASNLSIGLRYS